MRAASPPGRTPSWGTISAAPTRCRSTWPRRPAASSPPGSRARCGGTGPGRRAAAGHPGPPRARPRGPRFRANTVKIMQDGVAENFTAGMLDPYHDPTGCHEHGSGLSYVDPVALLGYVTQLDAHGFQVHLHAIGDRAVREALNAIEAARTANGSNDNRHHIAHLQVVHPDDVPRFAGLGVTANMQGLWAAHEPQMDELTIPFIGPERTARQYVFGDLLRSGARLAAGSDWAVSSANPLRAIHVAVNRSLQGSARGPSRSCPARAWNWPRRSRPTRSARRTLITWMTRPARSSPASWPTSWCSTATRSRPARRDRQPAVGHLRAERVYAGRSRYYSSASGASELAAGDAGPLNPRPGRPQVSRRRPRPDGHVRRLRPGRRRREHGHHQGRARCRDHAARHRRFLRVGHNELLLRDALRGVPRSSVFIQVKFGGQRDPRGAFIGHDTSPVMAKNSLAYSLTGSAPTTSTCISRPGSTRESRSRTRSARSRR